jgi:phosphinothricin acetyltransferase
MTGFSIRPAKPGDLASIADIYNHYVLQSTCTFQTEPDTLEGRKEWLDLRGDRYPVLVAEVGGEVVGWGSLSRFHPRSSAWHTLEDSVYVRHDMRGKGIGKALLYGLIERGRALGFHSIVAGIAHDQPASIALHEKLGFREVAHLREVGYKQDTWIDVKMFQLML